MVYLSLQSSTNLRQGLFAQGTLKTGQATAVALPLSAIRTDKPQPYVQLVKDRQVHHQTVLMGARGDHQGQSMVGITGIEAGTVVISGTAGLLREGTPVTLASGAP